MGSQAEADLPTVYRRIASLFLRLLVLELAQQTHCRAPKPALPLSGGWDHLEQSLQALDRLLGAPAENSNAAPANVPSPAALEVALEAARLAAGTPGSALTILTSVWQDLQAHHPVMSAGGFVLHPHRHGRKANGSFYTPTWLASVVVGESVRHLGGSRSLRVLDPAAGTGVFLLEAASRLSALTGRSRGEVAETCLYGVEADPLSVELAIFSLWLETGARPDVLARHIRCGNVLDGGPPVHPDFDLVIGNPPWGAELSAEERDELSRRFPRSTRDGFDSFKLFLDLAASSARDSVGMIVPQAMLTQRSYADVRSVLLERFDPYFAARLGDGVFPGATAPAGVLVFGPKPGPEGITCLDLTRTPTGLQQTIVPRRQWSRHDGFRFSDSDLLELCGSLTQRHPALGQLESLFRVRDAGINYNRAAVAARVLYASHTPDDVRDVARYRGRDFARYTEVRPSGWIRHDAACTLQPGEALHLDWRTYRLEAKIVLRQTADRLVATLDRSQAAMGRSVIAVTQESDVPLHGLLACLNSRLLTVFYRCLAEEQGRVLPQVKVGRLLALPVPERWSDPLWRSLAELAERRLGHNGQETSLDHQIDTLVYRLYDLTDREIALIELAP